MHSGASDPREAGRKSGEARRRPNPERVHQNLREYLRANVEPAEVWTALKLAMEGENESARVAASRVLMDALTELNEDKTEQRQADRRRANAEAKARLSALLAARARADEHRDLLEELAERLDAESIADHPDLILGDVSTERCAEIFAGLEEVGLIVSGARVEELAERRAQERLAALKAEHGIPHP
jgi:hypothetical protein